MVEQAKEPELADQVRKICKDKGIDFDALNCAIDAGKIAQDYGIRGETLGDFIFRVYEKLKKI